MSQPETSKPKKERLWTKDFIVVTLINFIILVNYFMLMVTMTSYTMDVYAAPEVVAAFCASIFIVGALVSRVITGALMVRFGRKRILLIGAVCDVLFTALYLVGSALPVLFALRFLHGFFYGMCSTAVGTIVTAIVPSSRKGEGVGYYMLSVTLGSALGPSLGIAIANNFSFSLLLVLDTFIAVLALISAVILKVPEVTNPLWMKQILPIQLPTLTMPRKVLPPTSPHPPSALRGLIVSLRFLLSRYPLWLVLYSLGIRRYLRS